MQTPPSLNLVIGVDGSAHSQAAVRFVRALALPPGSTVTALGVLTGRNYLYAPGRDALLSALDEAEAALRGEGVLVHTGLRHGHPAEELGLYGDEHAPDLMVLGARGLQGALSILLGGIAQQVIENAHWPVLVVREPHGALRRVLLASDGSAHSQHAARYLSEFPLPPEVEITVLHVLPPELDPAALTQAGVGGEGAAPEAAQQLAAEQNRAEAEAGQQQLDEAVRLLRARGLAAEGQLLRGDAATEIIEHATDDGSGLIVAGARGQSGPQGWRLGSVARKLVHYAPCSALIVRARDSG
jgi:nucleotide-binding universal stress UspA family protein